MPARQPGATHILGDWGTSRLRLDPMDRDKIADRRTHRRLAQRHFRRAGSAAALVSKSM